MKQSKKKLFIVVMFLLLIMLFLCGCQRQDNNRGRYQVAVSPVKVIRIDTVTGNSWMMHMTSEGTKHWVLIKEPYDSKK